MLAPEKPLSEISDNLLQYLRSELDDPAIQYDVPLTQMQGGYETCTYRFSLSGIRGELSNPLVLRLYPAFYGSSNAIWESTIQNVLADAGYPVPRVYLTCADLSILGGAFYLMAYLAGELMITASFETIPGMLGEAHAALHRIDPAPVIQRLLDLGFDERRYRLSGRLDSLQERASRYPWLRDGVDWLVDLQPSEPTRLSICHGDFHPMNILVRDGRITGVLDWPGFLIADPVLDVANTLVLTSISAKHLLGLTETDPVVELYLRAYRAKRPLDLEHLAYYRARRCIIALAEGAGGQQVWRQPAIVQDLVEYVYTVTGCRIAPVQSS